jgi:crotonobetaine/carnitine-CoA ligase
MQAPPKLDDSDNSLESILMGPLLANFDEFAERFGVRIATGYAMTEIGGPLASQGWDLPNAFSCGTIRTGYPDYELRVVDEHDEPVGLGEIGELIIRTGEPWNLNSGYFNMPEKTAEAWRNGWFHTGDGFKVDEEGNYYFVDRLKDAIRRRGENISSFEVEAYVMRHPAVAEVAAVAAPSEHMEDEVKVVVVRRPGEEVTAEELIEFLIPIMPRFMIPRYVEFIAELPKTDTTQRVRKMILREDVLNENTWDREAAGIELPKNP